MMPNGEEVQREIAQLQVAIRELERRVQRMEEAIYGNGRDQGILERLAKLEERIEGLSKKIGDMEKHVNLNVKLTVGTFLTIIVTIVTMLLRG